jgi:PilZ domain
MSQTGRESKLGGRRHGPREARLPTVRSWFGSPAVPRRRNHGRRRRGARRVSRGRTRHPVATKIVLATQYVTNTNSTGPNADCAPILGVVEHSREDPVGRPKSLSPERRASTRFGMRLDLSYTSSDRRTRVNNGLGRTIDLSSSGLRFAADKPLLMGQKLDVSIDWPVLLDGAVRLQLIMSGVVVRADGTTIALQIGRHEFRTRRVGGKTVPRKESVG